MSTPNSAERRTELVDGLHAMVRFVEQLPADLVVDALPWAFDRVNIWTGRPELVAALAQAGARAGMDVTKEVTRSDDADGFAGVLIRFGPAVVWHVYTDRANLCERVVVGQRMVVEAVPDPELVAALPKVEASRVVEDVQWRCGPVLAAVGDR